MFGSISSEDSLYFLWAEILRTLNFLALPFSPPYREPVRIICIFHHEWHLAIPRCLGIPSGPLFYANRPGNRNRRGKSTLGDREISTRHTMAPTINAACWNNWSVAIFTILVWSNRVRISLFRARPKKSRLCDRILQIHAIACLDKPFRIEKSDRKFWRGWIGGSRLPACKGR